MSPGNKMAVIVIDWVAGRVATAWVATIAPNNYYTGGDMILANGSSRATNLRCAQHGFCRQLPDPEPSAGLVLAAAMTAMLADPAVS